MCIRDRRNTSLLLVALLLAGTGEKLWLGFVPVSYTHLDVYKRQE